MESLTPEIAPFGISTMLIEPGFFRTELLTNDSATYGADAMQTFEAKANMLLAQAKAYPELSTSRTHDGV